ncbi:MAG: thiol peroxidase [Muribaculaceae bacterium]|nr:thiol peroxidase [Muribaculaceae bacterium]MDE7097026.1 thiol peroxidase [Muribaculaceae bacterium]
MATVKFQGAPVKTVGELPVAGTVAPAFSLAAQDLSDFDLESLKGKRVVLNIFPSIDTDVCAASVRKFNVVVSSLPETVVVCVSADLPFAANRFCAANGISNVVTGSTFRSDFGKAYGVEFAEGPLRGLMARSVVVIDRDGKVLGSKMVEEQTDEPDYSYVQSLLA